MAAGGTAVQGRRPLQFCCKPEGCCAAESVRFPAQQNRFLHRRLRGAGAEAPSALTAAPPAAVDWLSSMMRTSSVEVHMGMFQSVGAASDRVMAALVAGLELEFGTRAAEGMAQRFLAAEECDFHWDARVSERWLGTYECVDGQELELDRVAILGRIDGHWFVAEMIVDGDGRAHGMIAKRAFSTGNAARKAFAARR
ncbi:hypothetical protein [Sphingomonas sp. RT2P30]|uniref:hypothetical protein n=1 Tax=Parasphingomonas halimpatiens TaxID=3096162 RepID=UPI002FC6FB49